MQNELEALAAALQARGGELAGAEARLAARLRWGIALLRRLVDARVCRAVLAAWRWAVCIIKGSNAHDTSYVNRWFGAIQGLQVVECWPG